eukprot:g1943.t1
MTSLDPGGDPTELASLVASLAEDVANEVEKRKKVEAELVKYKELAHFRGQIHREAQLLKNVAPDRNIRSPTSVKQSKRNNKWKTLSTTTHLKAELASMKARAEDAEKFSKALLAQIKQLNQYREDLVFERNEIHRRFQDIKEIAAINRSLLTLNNSSKANRLATTRRTTDNTKASALSTSNVSTDLTLTTSTDTGIDTGIKNGQTSGQRDDSSSYTLSDSEDDIVTNAGEVVHIISHLINTIRYLQRQSIDRRARISYDQSNNDGRTPTKEYPVGYEGKQGNIHETHVDKQHADSNVLTTSRTLPPDNESIPNSFHKKYSHGPNEYYNYTTAITTVPDEHIPKSPATEVQMQMQHLVEPVSLAIQIDDDDQMQELLVGPSESPFLAASAFCQRYNIDKSAANKIAEHIEDLRQANR